MCAFLRDKGANREKKRKMSKELQINKIKDPQCNFVIYISLSIMHLVPI